MSQDRTRRSNTAMWRIDETAGHPQHTAQLGPELDALVARLQAALIEVLPITGLAAPGSNRATFRLTFADGRVLKGRRLDAAADASRINAIVGALARPELPRVVAWGGTALLEEWIEGEPLAAVIPDLSFVEQCGRILGAIHATPFDATWGKASGAGPAQADRVEVYRSHVEWTIGELLRDGVLSAAVAVELRAIVRDHVPRDASTGFVHGDFCGENIVRRADGEPSVVDSGSLGIGAHDFDLARTWYRWPLPDAHWRAFGVGYRTSRAMERYMTHFPFWCVTVLTDAALFRYRARTAGWRIPLRRLERVFESLRGGHGDRY
jgi:hypothetical protein